MPPSLIAASRDTDLLCGWKDISRYLAKGVRTVQRYERELGLPIRRPAGRMKGAVIATKVELDAWVQASPVRRGFTLSRSAAHGSKSALRAFQSTLMEMRRLREEMRQSTDKLRDSIESCQLMIRLIGEGSFRNVPKAAMGTAVSESLRKDVALLLLNSTRPKLS